MSAVTLVSEPGTEDLFVQGGRTLVLMEGKEACAQSVRQATKMRLGENQFNKNEGVDYFGTVFTPQANYDAFRASLVKNILAVPDVVDIRSLEVTQTGDHLDFIAEVVSTAGVFTTEVNV